MVKYFARGENVQNLFIFIITILTIATGTVVGNIFFMKFIYMKLKKYNINDYFYCSYGNNIYMRVNLILYKKYDYNFHKVHLYNNFDCLKINQEFYCKSHSLTLKYLKCLEEKKYIAISKAEKEKKRRIWLYEMQLGNKKIKRKAHNCYRITFYVLKRLPKSIDELEP